MKKIFYFGLSLLILSTSLMSCKDLDEQSTIGGPAYQSVIKSGILRVFNEEYLYNDQVRKDVNPAQYSNFDQMVNDLMVSPDVFSYLLTVEEFESAVLTGAFAGHGYSAFVTQEQRMFLGVVFRNSPADEAGFTRGTEILRINGSTISSLISSGQLNAAIGPSTPGVVNEFEVRDLDGTIRTVSVGKRVITPNTVLHDEVYDIDGVKVGYVAFNSFRQPSVQELNTVFNRFKAEGITEIIIDLRYNGGGLVQTAVFFANAIAPASARNKAILKFTYNEDKSENNFTVPFTNNDYNFEFERFFFIQAGGTASASELLINGMAGVSEVITIGSNSFGKPVGQSPFEIGNLIFYATNFTVRNELDFDDYFDGIPADILAPDDVTKNWGDPTEPRLAAALDYIRNGGQTGFRYSKEAVEEPLWAPYMLKGLAREIGAF